MTTHTNGTALCQYFAARACYGQYHIVDDCHHEYSVIGCEYHPSGDRVLIEIDPNYYREHAENGLSINPTKVIFNGPATIVFWDDGTKTVVKCTERETFDYEKGVALCYMKKLLGNDNSFKHIFKKFNIPK